MNEDQWIAWNLPGATGAKQNKIGIVVVIILLAGLVVVPCVTVAGYLLNK